MVDWAPGSSSKQGGGDLAVLASLVERNKINRRPGRSNGAGGLATCVLPLSLQDGGLGSCSDSLNPEAREGAAVTPATEGATASVLGEVGGGTDSRAPGRTPAASFDQDGAGSSLLF